MINRVQSHNTNKYNPCFGTIKATPPNALEVIESAIMLLRKPNINSSLPEERELAPAAHFLADKGAEALELAKTMNSKILLKGNSESSGAKFSLEITGIDGKSSISMLTNMPSRKSSTSTLDVIRASAKLLSSFAKTIHQAHIEEESIINEAMQRTSGVIN